MFLKQSTSVDVPVGPFVDSTDGFTAETGLTITQPDVRLKKNAGAWAQKAAAQTLTHEENGWYEVTLDATDTNTLGVLQLAVHETGALPVFHTFHVVTANVWDTLFSTDRFDVEVAAIANNAITAASINADAITAAKVADGAIDAATFAAGAINAAAIAADAFTAAKFAADVTTEFQSGLATAAAVATIDDFLDTEIAAIITTLGTPAGASISADIAAIEAQTDDIGVAGAGLTAIPWNAAWDAEVQSEVTDALVAYDPPTHAELTAEIDAVQTDVAGLNNLSAAQVNAEVVDALNVDTYGEPTGVPAATATVVNKLGFVHMALRNRIDVTSTKKQFYDDAGNVEWEKDLSDDGTTYSETEANAP